MAGVSRWPGRLVRCYLAVSCLGSLTGASYPQSGECKGKAKECTDLSEKKSDLRVCDDATCRYGGICRDDGAQLKCVCQFQCHKSYVPVCGSNGDTFQNECYRRQASCKQQRLISRASDGPCYADSDDYEGSSVDGGKKFTKCGTCKYGAECDEDSEDVWCICNIDCSGHNENPVCGTDGNSFNNPCLVREASCMKQEQIDVKHLGRCPGRRGTGHLPLVPSLGSKTSPILTHLLLHFHTPAPPPSHTSSSTPPPSHTCSTLTHLLQRHTPPPHSHTSSSTLTPAPPPSNILTHLLHPHTSSTLTPPPPPSHLHPHTPPPPPSHLHHHTSSSTLKHPHTPPLPLHTSSSSNVTHLLHPPPPSHTSSLTHCLLHPDKEKMGKKDASGPFHPDLLETKGLDLGEGFYPGMATPCTDSYAGFCVHGKCELKYNMAAC
ncbi:hypothetical protein NHX12_004585, partial [Muraenolepis orangiensis]